MFAGRDFGWKIFRHDGNGGRLLVTSYSNSCLTSSDPLS
jgi:hypothetical protein